MKLLYHLIAAALLAAASPAFAQNASDYNSVAIHSKGEGIHHIAMDEGNLTLKENGTALRFENSGISVEYTVQEIEYLTFETYDFAQDEYYVGSMSSGVESAKLVEPSFRFVGKTVVVSGMAAGSRMAVYTLAGVPALSAVADSEGRAEISLSGMPAGVYLLSGGGLKCKITLKP